MDLLIQLGIGFTGGVAIFLSQQSSPYLKKFACIFGLLGQPFWMWMAVDKGLWAVAALNLFYAYSWGVGLYNNWIKKEKK